MALPKDPDSGSTGGFGSITPQHGNGSFTYVVGGVTLLIIPTSNRGLKDSKGRPLWDFTDRYEIQLPDGRTLPKGSKVNDHGGGRINVDIKGSKDFLNFKGGVAYMNHHTSSDGFSGYAPPTAYYHPAGPSIAEAGKGTKPVHDPVHEKAIGPSPAPVVPASGAGGKVPGGAAPSGSGGYDMNRFARDLLGGLGINANPKNVAAILAWAQAERRSAGRPDGFNPLNTTQPWTGTSDFNSVGVKNYQSYEDGLAATIKTLKNGRYQAILQALSTDPGSLGSALKVTPWGTNGDNVTHIMTGGNIQNVTLTGSASGSHAGTVTYSGSVGGGDYSGYSSTGGASGTGAGMPGWDQHQFELALSQAGFATGLIHSDASLMKVFNDAVKNKWDATEFQTAIQNTSWFKSRSSSQRSWDELIFSDNAQAHRMLETTKSQIKAQVAQLGVNMTDVALTHITHVAVRNGLTTQEIQSMIGAQSKYKPTAAYGGTLGQSVDQLKQLSADYNIPLSDSLIQQFSQNIVSGKADIEKYKQYVQQQAISKYPWLKDQINAGFTVAQLADPYKNAMSQVLEIDPQTIKLSDATLSKGMQYMDPSLKGAYTTMPLWKFQETLKSDPRWLKTNNARDSLMDTGTGVLRDMGLIY